ncbi:ead/Ea22-like family protein [Enterobacter hormaechei]|uniref:ead/Ea22-like family protein n=1 Tax=Enterobacter hormaechei TaxID=158836 RepID=UPI000F65C674|nr:ead/Ea22-like family protein [Enterobacter hormaechei]QXR29712.1 ead/Ea22-like family protein [Enterobacter hormaechei]HDC4293783.1 ead/Ea22-like family protein [Enterobacter hormaechei]
MSNINKQDMRLTAEKAKDNFMPNFMVPTRDLLALLDELEAAENRIAELEARGVREEGNQFLIVRHPGKAPVIKHCAGDMEQFLQQLIAQDSLATIDIVTHRYYGVGGQWVQDADEYLQIAGIITKVGE